MKNCFKVRFIQSEILNVECRSILTTLSYRICFGEKMTASAITVNEVDDIEFLLNIFRNFQLLFSVNRIIYLRKFESVEKLLPACFYRRRIFYKLFIQFIDLSNVCISE